MGERPFGPRPPKSETENEFLGLATDPFAAGTSPIIGLRLNSRKRRLITLASLRFVLWFNQQMVADQPRILTDGPFYGDGHFRIIT